MDFYRKMNKVPFPSPTTLNQIGRVLTVMGGQAQSSSSRIHGSERTKYIGIPLSPNLSSCQSSLSDGNRTLHCCPARSYSDKPIIDFVFPTPSTPIRIRQPAHRVSKDYLTKYEKAVAIMKQLPPDHPHNFWRQANIHCAYCTGAYNQANATIPLMIHRSWLFLPWHRIFLYFHERILGKLIGDDTFALPFWNWDSPEGMMIPYIYTEGSLSNENRDPPHLPPKVVDLDFSGSENSLKPKDQIATNLALMFHQMVSGAKKPELFMGCKLRSGVKGMCDGPGTLEAEAHNSLHSWVGSKFNPEREDMGAFYSAARDPIFYAHHANIDRLWTSWKRLHKKKLEFANSEWLDSHFYFYDENVNLVRVKVRDCLNIAKLRYSYVEVNLPWLNASVKPAVPPNIARNILRTRKFDGELGLAATSKESNEAFQGPWTLDKIITVRVDRHRRKGSMKEKKEEVLVVYGIDIKKDTYVKFDVFVNAVNETMRSTRSREFAGSFINVPNGVKSAMRMKSNLKLGISELLKDLEADEDDSIWVTLVPRGKTGVRPTVDGLRIEYI